MKQPSPMLFGNSFPLPLLRRRTVVEPVPLDALRAAAAGRELRSYWGHASTLAAAEALLGRAAAPRSDRPALEVSENGLPMLDGEEFNEAWVLSPQLAPGHRPAPGAEILPAAITGWTALHFTWP